MDAAVNMKQSPPLKNGFISVGTIEVTKGQPIRVTISSKDAGGTTHADAVQLVPAK